MTLTLAYISGRELPYFDWFIAGLNKQFTEQETKETQILFISPFVGGDAPPRVIVSYAVPGNGDRRFGIEISKPKPCVWQGPHRLTKEDWWAMSNARNTAICLARGDYIVFVDDRCVLGPEWMQAVREAMAGNYAVAGSYSKVHNMVVEYDAIQSFQNETQDSRLPYAKPGCNPCGGEWFFGCSCGLPLEWALNINGYDEDADSLSFEDCLFGLMLQKNNYPIRFDTRMKVIQDRTLGALGPIYKRTDKGVSPNDKSHRILNMVLNEGRHKAPNYFGEGGIRALRERVLRGEPFPIVQSPQHDWFDAQPVADFV